MSNTIVVGFCVVDIILALAFIFGSIELGKRIEEEQTSRRVDIHYIRTGIINLENRIGKLEIREMERETRMKNVKYSNCYWYHEYQDMSASVPTCDYYRQYGECPCEPECKHFITKREVDGIVRNMRGEEDG